MNRCANQPSTKAVDTSTSNVPTAFTTTNTSQKLTGLADKGYSHVQVINGTSTAISFVTLSGPTAPGATSTARAFVPANGAITLDDYPVYDNFYIQSEGLAISSGLIYIHVW